MPAQWVRHPRRAGFAFRDTSTASPQSNYFIRLTAPTPVDDVIAMVNGLDFSVADDGTGPRTLSKRELIALFDAGYDATFGGQSTESAA